FSSIMGHMIDGSITVRSGQSVSQQQQIGRVGWTGMTSFGPHVHLEIHHAGAPGGRVMIEQYFNRSMLKECALCNVSGAAVQAAGTVGSDRSPYASGAGAGSHVWSFAAGLVVMAFLVGWFYSPEHWLAFSLWHGGSVAALLLLVLFRPAATVAASSGSPLSTGSQAFEIAYKFTAGAEGWQCTHDPIRTFGGITQGTYTAWRMSHALGPADVCGSLTEQQRRQIFNERYWVASGANRLPAPLAITYVDHTFNTGSGSGGLSACGNNVKCFNDWRIFDYRSKRNCSRYCQAWINRVNRIRGATEN
ncbi:MAG: peptidoglycan DD-metalloendopeptidase family protein, partial [Caldilineaceae bacterium]|nr:peptidoglycan DD-metalloendopeptidase family protein [Caldilineaceae bacterium]